MMPFKKRVLSFEKRHSEKKPRKTCHFQTGPCTSIKFGTFVQWSCSTSFFQQVFFVVLFHIIVFMLSKYESSSLTQLTIYSQFLRANYKESGLKPALLLVAILKLIVSSNAMAGNSVGVEDCEIHVLVSSLPSTTSQDNVENSLDKLSIIQRTTRLVVQIYH